MGESKRRNISSFSVISFAVSVIAFFGLFGSFGLPSGLSQIVLIYSACLAIASPFLPPIAKSKRLHVKKQGKVLEILAIIVGGFDFYFVVFALTEFPNIIGFLGWIICGVVYHLIKINDIDSSAVATTGCSQSDNGATETAVPETRCIAEECIKDNNVSSQQDDTDRNKVVSLSVEINSDTTSREKSIGALYCHKCGAKLYEGSFFCSKCGTKVWTGDKE